MEKTNSNKTIEKIIELDKKLKEYKKDWEKVKTDIINSLSIYEKKSPSIFTVEDLNTKIRLVVRIGDIINCINYTSNKHSIIIYVCNGYCGEVLHEYNRFYNIDNMIDEIQDINEKLLNIIYLNINSNLPNK